jgi:branched-chain amino acid transport system substrate-binding protein
MIHEVMKQTGGKWPGAEEVVKPLAAVKVDAPRGPVSLDDMRNPIQNTYIRQAVLDYGKEKFLQRPVNSRNFPRC